MERLKSRRVLEEFSQFLAPLKLPITLRLRTQQCGEVNAFYDPANSSIILCYEYVADIEDRAPRATTPEGITREEVIIGQIVGTLLHEGGHAVSNLLRLPVLGREEDTADQIAAFVMLQFGRDVARTLIKGETYGWNQRQRTQSRVLGPAFDRAAAPAHVPLPRLWQRPRSGSRISSTKFGWLPKAAGRQLRERIQADPARLPRDHPAPSRHGLSSVQRHGGRRRRSCSERWSFTGMPRRTCEVSRCSAEPRARLELARVRKPPVTAPTRSPSAAAPRSRARPR